MAMATTASPVVYLDPFQTGPYHTKWIKVDPCSKRKDGKCSDSSPPRPAKPLLIYFPSQDQEQELEVPVVMLLHGYLMYNSFYTQLMEHIASHGFILVAPQMYTIAGPDSTNEIDSAAEITSWFFEGLQSFLPNNIHPDLTKLVISGHSRGGKVAFSLAAKDTTFKFSALIGIDPVDGTPHPVLTSVPNSIDIGMPVLIIGSGYGDVAKNCLSPPCAPEGVNHEEFDKECMEPKWYFVAKDYGHLDMLNDKTDGIRGIATHCICKNGKSREPMRVFVGGYIVKFLEYFLEGKTEKLMLLKDKKHLGAPVELLEAQFHLSK